MNKTLKLDDAPIYMEARDMDDYTVNQIVNQTASHQLDQNEQKILDEIMQKFTYYFEELGSRIKYDIYKQMDARRLFVMYEDELGCDPETDHVIARSVLPIYKPLMERAFERLHALQVDNIRYQIDVAIRKVAESNIHTIQRLKETERNLSKQVAELADLAKQRQIIIEQMQQQILANDIRSSNRKLTENELERNRGALIFKADCQDSPTPARKDERKDERIVAKTPVTQQQIYNPEVALKIVRLFNLLLQKSGYHDKVHFDLRRIEPAQLNEIEQKLMQITSNDNFSAIEGFIKKQHIIFDDETKQKMNEKWAIDSESVQKCAILEKRVEELTQQLESVRTDPPPTNIRRVSLVSSVNQDSTTQLPMIQNLEVDGITVHINNEIHEDNVLKRIDLRSAQLSYNDDPDALCDSDPLGLKEAINDMKQQEKLEEEEEAEELEQDDIVEQIKPKLLNNSKAQIQSSKLQIVKKDDQKVETSQNMNTRIKSQNSTINKIPHQQLDIKKIVKPPSKLQSSIVNTINDSIAQNVQHQEKTQNIYTPEQKSRTFALQQQQQHKTPQGENRPVYLSKKPVQSEQRPSTPVKPKKPFLRKKFTPDISERTQFLIKSKHESFRCKTQEDERPKVRLPLFQQLVQIQQEAKLELEVSKKPSLFQQLMSQRHEDNARIVMSQLNRREVVQEQSFRRPPENNIVKLTDKENIDKQIDGMNQKIQQLEFQNGNLRQRLSIKKMRESNLTSSPRQDVKSMKVTEFIVDIFGEDVLAHQDVNQQLQQKLKQLLQEYGQKIADQLASNISTQNKLNVLNYAERIFAVEIEKRSVSVQNGFCEIHNDLVQNAIRKLNGFYSANRVKSTIREGSGYSDVLDRFGSLQQAVRSAKSTSEAQNERRQNVVQIVKLGESEL